MGYPIVIVFHFLFYRQESCPDAAYQRDRRERGGCITANAHVDGHGYEHNAAHDQRKAREQ
jgi:hypothetical protein